MNTNEPIVDEISSPTQVSRSTDLHGFSSSPSDFDIPENVHVATVRILRICGFKKKVATIIAFVISVLICSVSVFLYYYAKK